MGFTPLGSFIKTGGDKFRYPDIKYQTQAPITPTAGISKITDRYGDFLDAFLTGNGVPGQSFDSYVSSMQGGYNASPGAVKQSPYLDEAAGVARGVVSGLGDMRETGAPVNTRPLYDASLANIQRQFDTKLLPQLKESLGARGARYGTDIIRQGANTYGDLQKQIEVEAAKSEIGAQEAARGRRLSAADITGRQAPTFANIGALVQALSESNRKFAYETDYARQNPMTYFPFAQNYINTRPIFPQIVTGGPPTYLPEETYADYAQQSSGTLKNVAGAAGSVAGAAGSSREFKEDIKPLSNEAKKYLVDEMENLNVMAWRYKREYEDSGKLRVGPVVEDMPALLTQGQAVDMMSMNGAQIVVIQHLLREVRELRREIEELKVNA